MKTTIEIADELLTRAKRHARRERKTLRDVVEEALRQKLAEPGRNEPFQLKKHPFKGEGQQPAVVEGQWETVRDLIYRLG
jgi:Arc/MetJ family transcription regulator